MSLSGESLVIGSHSRESFLSENSYRFNLKSFKFKKLPKFNEAIEEKDNEVSPSDAIHNSKLGFKIKDRAPNFDKNEEVKSEGNMSFRAKLEAIEDKEDALSHLSSLPSETEEESVAAVIKSKEVHTNQLTMVETSNKGSKT